MRIIALLPAHNEEAGIGSAVRSLQSQSRAPDSIVVIADNCTDGTVREALSAGASVYLTRDNFNKKAGALNQYLSILLPTLDAEDAVLVQDADSEIVPRFLESAVAAMQDKTVGAVGGIFRGITDGSLVGKLQDNEYARYEWDINRKNGKAWVLTGTATLHRVSVLLEVREQRSKVLPAGMSFYDTAVLTEDNEITLAIKTLGYRCISPSECIVYTEVMPTWSDLWKQRLRWQRGAIENIKQYGPTKTLRPYILQQGLMMLGVMGFTLFLIFSVMVTVQGMWGFSLFWSLVGGVFVLERIITVWKRGWRARVLALPMVIELGFDLFLQAVLVRSLFEVITQKEAQWHHVTAEVLT